MGAVKGTNLKDLCNLVGGMNAGETVRVRASDGLSMTFAVPKRIRIFLQGRPDGGNMVLCRSCVIPRPYRNTGYTDGMRLVWFADTSVNPWGEHVFGNYDWHEVSKTGVLVLLRFRIRTIPDNNRLSGQIYF